MPRRRDDKQRALELWVHQQIGYWALMLRDHPDWSEHEKGVCYGRMLAYMDLVNKLPRLHRLRWIQRKLWRDKALQQVNQP